MTHALPAGPTLALSALLLACFLGMRLALLWRFPPFVDEALYASWAWQVYEDHDRLFVSLAYGKEPLLPWLGAVIMGAGVAPLTAVRLVSILSALVTLVCTALIARELGGRGAAWLAAATCVVLPFFVVHDVIGIYDPLATATVSASLLLLVRHRPAAHPLATAGLGVALGAGLLTKQTTYLSIALLPVGLLLLDLRRPGRGMRLFSWLMRLGIAVAIALALYSVMTLSEYYRDLARVREFIYPSHSVSEALESPGYWIERNWPAFRGPLAVYLTAPVIVLAAVGVGIGIRRRARLTAVVVVWAVAPIGAAVLLGDATYPRYLLTAVPPIVVLAGYGGGVIANALRTGLAPRTAAVASVVAAAVALLPALVFDARVLADPAAARYPGIDDRQYVTGWPAGGPFRRVASDLRRLRADDEVTILIHEPYSDTLQMLLWSEPGLSFVRHMDGATGWAVTNGTPLPEPDGPVTWRLIARYDRPRGGTPVSLYQRGLYVSGTFVTTPDELRQALALPDAGFDAYLARNPAVREWHLQWYSARE